MKMWQFVWITVATILALGMGASDIGWELSPQDYAQFHQNTERTPTVSFLDIELAKE